MAVLQNAEGKRFTLAARTLVGRSRGCTVRIESPRVSGEHASITWTKDHWTIRDLGSSNGTLVGTQRLANRERVPLRKGTPLTFADIEFVLTCIAPPTARAVRQGDADTVEDDGDGLLILAESPHVIAVVPRDEGWVLDAMPAAERPVVDQEVVAIDGAEWRLELPPTGDTTDSTERLQAIWLPEAKLTFRVSRDGEHVTAELEAPELAPVQLPARIYQQVLLALARERLADTQRGIEPRECGWVYADDLQQQVGMDRTRVNIELHRARKALQRLGVLSPEQIVERRLDTQQLRLGVERVVIEEE